jgi:hypothetical protein
MNNPYPKNIEISTNEKKLKYFPEQDLIIKGSGSVEDPVDLAEEDTDIYSDEENPKAKKIANKMVSFTFNTEKPKKTKLKIRRSIKF